MSNVESHLEEDDEEYEEEEEEYEAGVCVSGYACGYTSVTPKVPGYIWLSKLEKRCGTGDRVV